MVMVIGGGFGDYGDGENDCPGEWQLLSVFVDNEQKQELVKQIDWEEMSGVMTAAVGSCNNVYADLCSNVSGSGGEDGGGGERLLEQQLYSDDN